jgi:hypothetical protein
MNQGFRILRRIENGGLLEVAWRATLEKAEQYVKEIGERWPHGDEIIVAPAHSPQTSLASRKKYDPECPKCGRDLAARREPRRTDAWRES